MHPKHKVWLLWHFMPPNEDFGTMLTCKARSKPTTNVESLSTIQRIDNPATCESLNIVQLASSAPGNPTHCSGSSQ